MFFLPPAHLLLRISNGKSEGTLGWSSHQPEGELSCGTLLRRLPCRRLLLDTMGMELWVYLPTSRAKKEMDDDGTVYPAASLTQALGRISGSLIPCFLC